MHLTKNLLNYYGVSSSAKIEDFLDNAAIECLENATYGVRIPSTIDQETLNQLPIVNTASAPWMIEEGLLVPGRYWRTKQSILTLLKERCDKRIDIDYVSTPSLGEEQNQAIEQSLQSAFHLICGGPGSGKTTIARHLIEYSISQNPNLDIALCAPTNKAASRLRESLGYDENKVANHLTIGTLHSILGIGANSFAAVEPIPYDVVIVDEVSMLTFELAAKLLEASRWVQHIIWMGDDNQLDSVELGGVIHLVKKHQPNYTVYLRKHYRFDSDSIIDCLAQATLNNQFSTFEFEAARHQLFFDEAEKIQRLEQFVSEKVTHWRTLAKEEKWQALLDSQSEFALLTPQRKGSKGLVALNKHLSNLFASSGILPILFEENGSLYTKGDQGFSITSVTGSQYLLANHENKAVLIDPSVPYAPAWVFTVHQAQGSEFDCVWLWIDDSMDERLFIRSLLYTAVTRARKSFAILGSAETTQKFFDCEN